MPEYVLSIQRNLSGNEFWTISASVNATVSRYNLSSEAYRSNDSLWKDTFKYSASDLGRNGFTSYQLYNWYDFGLLPGNSSLLSDQPDGLLTFMGFYYELQDEGQTVISTKSFNDPSDPNSVAFRHNASMFNTRRERCEGTWVVNSTGIRLSSGHCYGTPTDQTVFTKEMADVLPVDALPILVSALHDFAAVRHSSPWKYPALTVSAATLYWSRMVFMTNGGTSVDNHWELLYPATNEKVTSTRTALRNRWVLYVVLVIQPVLILAAFSLNILFYSTPIGKGFGIVALLSGINGDCLEKIRGAAFTGELKRPVELRISVADYGNAGNVRRIEYTFGRANGEALVSRELVYR
ncbi:uncharacterized protein LY89DRAFT_700490 [Neofusicoccum parvum]|nr:uncharacterized protein LY89DRAFT_700490 [Neofusicoccum parvum]